MGRRLAPVGGAVDEAHELTALRRSVSHVNSAPYVPKGCLLPVRRTYVFETRQLCLNNATYVRVVTGGTATIPHQLTQATRSTTTSTRKSRTTRRRHACLV